MRGSALLLVLLFAGCFSQPDSEPGPEDPEPAGVVIAQDRSLFGPNATEPVLLAMHAEDSGFEFDVLCAMGGTDFYSFEELARPPANTAGLRFLVEVDAQSTGVQAGYRHEGEPTSWLPTVRDGKGDFFLAIDASDLTETTYHYQVNLEPAPQDCYTGARVLGALRIEVYAYPEGSTPV